VSKYIIIKRIFDILISLIGVFLSFLVIIFVFLANIITNDFGCPIFTQQRVGKNGKIFELYKIRTMEIDADEKLLSLLKNDKHRHEWDEFQKIEDDPRITKIGNFLRKHSIDELPQFINVIKGDMSIIGPRPLVDGELESHGGDTNLYQSVRPGITGWWACNRKENTTYKERLELEYYYINNCSFYLDLKCFLNTIIEIFLGKGAK